MIWRNIASNFLTLLIVLLIAAAAAVAWGKHQFTGPGPSAVAQCVQVTPGASLNAVSQQLAEQGAISNSYVFRAGADYMDKARDLKFGSYLVPPGASMEEIVGVITAGGPSTCGTEVIVRVGVRENTVLLRDMNPDTGAFEEMARFNPATETAPEAIIAAVDKPGARLRVAMAEGVTSWQVVEALKAATFMTGEVEEVPAEGSLAPDTYEVEKGASRSALLAEMAQRQSAILAAEWEARPFGLPYETPEEALIMASIVEKETGVADERPQVASVFVNRLEQGMRLETDPTVIYGITNGEGVLDRGLRRSELAATTPYNTYRVDGLPPTPIANPGRAAIRAALNPDTTDYLFFVADGTGGHTFSRTLAEHNAAVARWREIERQQGGDVTSPVQGDG
ncbi:MULTISPECIES: endolytic transglycosylase MltG [Paracoccus]|uniref:Endolytic murein transglycosylase n=1 Tax=Paracoccus aerius TaxID=1915382 RepID=A0ABS1S7N1_9RHOB|nr:MULTISPECIES: endolytic transglycosylase MltG [Paracoccus]MBL3674733.1 endolytic transglycosylase MltG [Paracoccus aerius]QIR84682.1 endolytic transglycosylase MltG [Paracoccus sp. AK26]GHG28731.1 branched-chain alpha-keto acid dehydrogenase subunit E2 [Paracoccus aerius]